MQTDAVFDLLVSNFWSLEEVGIREEDPTEERLSFEIFQWKIRTEEGRYQVPLPWKENKGALRSNYEQAHRRLQHLLLQLKDKELFEDYNRQLEEFKSSGLLSIAGKKAASQESGTYIMDPSSDLIRRPLEPESLETPLRETVEAQVLTTVSK